MTVAGAFENDDRLADMAGNGLEAHDLAGYEVDPAFAEAP
ncbi:hypothetical protein GCM10009000_055860 [Halobacterium noricense]